MKRLFQQGLACALLLGAIGAAPLFAGVANGFDSTAVTLQPGEYEAGGQTDLVFNHGGGVNVLGHFKAGVIADMFDLEGIVGTGKTDFEIGAVGKFNLLPDVPGQIALSFIGGYTYLRDDYGPTRADLSINDFMFGTVGSKKFDTDFGSMSPYAGFQVEMLFKRYKDQYPLTALLGSEWAITKITPWVLVSEFDFDVHDSVFMLSLGGGYRF